MTTKTTFNTMVKITVVLTVIAIFVYLLAWIPVADRIINWCEYYPQSLADCDGRANQ